MSAKQQQESGDRVRTNSEASDGEYDPQFTPIVQLPEVQVPTNEEDEEVVLRLRAKLYRFDRSDDIPEWKERGTGEVKMLKHIENKTVRIVMRRDKTLKVCANHFITPFMEIKAKPGTDKALIYNVPADFSDEEVKSECLAIKFASVEIANQFKNAFEQNQDYVKKECKLYTQAMPDDSDDSEARDTEDSDVEADADNKEIINNGNTVAVEKEAAATRDVTEKLNQLNVTKD